MRRGLQHRGAVGHAVVAVGGLVPAREGVAVPYRGGQLREAAVGAAGRNLMRGQADGVRLFVVLIQGNFIFCPAPVCVEGMVRRDGYGRAGGHLIAARSLGIPAVEHMICLAGCRQRGIRLAVLHLDIGRRRPVPAVQVEGNGIFILNPMRIVPGFVRGYNRIGFQLFGFRGGVRVPALELEALAGGRGQAAGPLADRPLTGDLLAGLVVPEEGQHYGLSGWLRRFRLGRGYRRCSWFRRCGCRGLCCRRCGRFGLDALEHKLAVFQRDGIIQLVADNPCGIRAGNRALCHGHRAAVCGRVLDADANPFAAAQAADGQGAVRGQVCIGRPAVACNAGPAGNLEHAALIDAAALVV